jgi:hypothetical protein
MKTLHKYKINTKEELEMNLQVIETIIAVLMKNNI